ncbi:DUF1883 domain-containing protein [Halanaerobium congolense]|jgi:hypothetical protein|nr:DUF1883 domain-containing protein [Halanaerobium congolense]
MTDIFLLDGMRFGLRLLKDYLNRNQNNKSQIKAEIPRTGHWYVVVDLGGYSGKVKSAVRVL